MCEQVTCAFRCEIMDRDQSSIDRVNSDGARHGDEKTIWRDRDRHV